MDNGGCRKRSNITLLNSSCKKTRQRKPEDSFSYETHHEHHVTNTSLLRGEQLRQEFVKKLITRRVINLCSSSSSITDSLRDLDSDTKTSEDIYHHDDLHSNHLNKVQLLW